MTKDKDDNKDVLGIDKKICQYSKSSNVNIRLMTMRTKDKYDKHSKNPHRINILLVTIFVFDSKSRLDFFNYFIESFIV